MTSNVKSSHYTLREKVVAAREMISRIREKYAHDPALMQLAGELEAGVDRVVAGLGGPDTRPSTAKVEAADDARDNADRAFATYLRALLYSDAHRPAWEAARALLRVIAPDGIDWVHDAFNVQTLRQHEIVKILETMTAEIAACSAQIFVDQLRTSQAAFEAAVAARGELTLDKPEAVTAVRRPFELALRTTLLRLESLENTAARQFVLEPFSRLSRQTPATPTPGAPAER